MNVDGDITAVRHGIKSIDSEVDDNLLKLVDVDAHWLEIVLTLDSKRYFFSEQVL